MTASPGQTVEERHRLTADIVGYNHDVDAEERHRTCWYARRTVEFPEDLGSHTIIDGELAYCAHPMYWPVVRYEFDLRNCENCDVYKARRGGDRKTE